MTSKRSVAIAAAIGSVLFALIAYNIGLSEGAARAAAASGALPPYAYWGWHRPWGVGFAFPFLFVLFWLAIARSFFWGPPWRRRWYYYDDAVPPSFEEWHRRAHERMSTDSTPRS
jgi:hypothetical protein